MNNRSFNRIRMIAIVMILGSCSYYADSWLLAEEATVSTFKTAPVLEEQKPGNALAAARLMSEAFVDVSRKVTPSIVIITNEVKEKITNDGLPTYFRQFFKINPEEREEIRKIIGSGVIISSDGLIVTNNHVVDHSAGLKVTLPNGNKVGGKIIGKDPKTDLALLKVDAKDLQPIHFANYKDLEVGEWVLAFGTPFGETLQHTVTAGILSATGRSNVGITDYEDFLQTDASINPGNSGGALVDLDGNLIGINTAILTSNGSNAGVSFAIPVNIVRKISQQLQQHGRVIRSYVGVTVQDLTPEMSRTLHLGRDHGAIVSEVKKSSPGQRAGMKLYDVIISLNGSPVQSNVELRNTVAELSPGSKAHFTIIRDDKEVNIEIITEEMPYAPAANEQSQMEDKKFGMEFQNITPALAQALQSNQTYGVVVTSVLPGSYAEEAGLLGGEVIFEVNRRQIRSVQDFDEVLQSTQDTHLLLAVEHQGSTFFVTLQKSNRR